MPACRDAAELPAGAGDDLPLRSAGRQSGLYTVGRLCLRGGQWRINNAGWNSAVDYVSAAERRTAADRALRRLLHRGILTDADQHVDAYLPQTAARHRLPMRSGSPAGTWSSTWPRAATLGERFQPDVLVVFVDGGDVTDSLRENGVVSPYWWQIGAEGIPSRRSRLTAVYASSRKASSPRSPRSSTTCATTRSSRCPACRGRQSRGPRRRPRPRRRSSRAGPPRRSRWGPGSPEAEADDAWRDLLAGRPVHDQDRLLADPAPGHAGRLRQPTATATCRPGLAGAPLFPGRDARCRRPCAPGPQCSFVDTCATPFLARLGDGAGVRFEAADGSHWNAYTNRPRRQDDRGPHQAARSAVAHKTVRVQGRGTRTVALWMGHGHPARSVGDLRGISCPFALKPASPLKGPSPPAVFDERRSGYCVASLRDERGGRGTSTSPRPPRGRCWTCSISSA